MLLNKYCRKEHNVKIASHIQIGTMFKYREIENNELQDGDEGKFKFEVDLSSEVEMESRLANLLFHGAIGMRPSLPYPRFPGATKIFVDHAHIISQMGNRLILGKSRATIERSGLNCFMFCMSHQISPNLDTFGDYDDCWSISEECANQLGMRIADLLLQKIKLSDLDSQSVANHSPTSIRNLRINLRHGPVIYQDRIHISNSVDDSTYDKLVYALNNIALVKPPSFQSENEYRFIFEISDGQNIISPVVNQVLLPLNVLDGLV